MNEGASVTTSVVAEATAPDSLETRLYERLTASGARYESFEHPAVFTVEESSAQAAFVPGLDIRNLFLRDRKRRFFLLCLPARLALDLKAFGSCKTATRLGITGRLSFANQDELLRKLRVSAGAVNPFAVMFDVENEVQIVIDKAIATSACFNAHPMRNDRSLTLSGAELLSFLAQERHEAIIFDFAQLEQTNMERI